MQNSDFWSRITYLYGSQTSPVVLCMQYSVISTRTTCLYGSQPSSVVFAFITATFGAELQVSMGPRPHQSFCECKIAWFAPEWQVCMSLSTHLWFCAIQKSDIRTRIACLHGSQTSPVILCMQIGVPSIRITSLNGFQLSSVLFGCKTSTFGSE